MLQLALSALLEGTLEKPDQVVVVNGGDAGADNIVNSFIGFEGIEVKLVKTVNKSLAASRNVGLPYCTGDIISLTDDDAEVLPDWVTWMKHAHREHPEAGAVGGLVIGTGTNTLVGKASDLVTFPSWPSPCYVRTLPGVNISYKREVIEKVGLQDETLFRGEDVDFNWRVKQLGYEIYFDPQIKVYHHHRTTLVRFLNQHYMYGRAYFLVRRKWPEMYCIYPHTFHRAKDLAKSINAVIGPFYQPFSQLRKMNTNFGDCLLLWMLLFSGGLSWRLGMLAQRVQQTD